MAPRRVMPIPTPRAKITALPDFRQRAPASAVTFGPALVNDSDHAHRCAQRAQCRGRWALSSCAMLPADRVASARQCFRRPVCHRLDTALSSSFRAIEHGGGHVRVEDASSMSIEHWQHRISLSALATDRLGHAAVKALYPSDHWWQRRCAILAARAIAPQHRPSDPRTSVFVANVAWHRSVSRSLTRVHSSPFLVLPVL